MTGRTSVISASTGCLPKSDSMAAQMSVRIARTAARSRFSRSTRSFAVVPAIVQRFADCRSNSARTFDELTAG